MTENEAIEFLKGKYPSWGCDEDEYENAQIAIQALDEIQQYRAIGTVKEIKSEHKELIKLSRRYLKDTDELIKYQEIGTIDEFKQAMNFKKYFMELYGEGLEVANWHKNGDLEPLVNFIDEACN